jgi:hypothetical protein
LSQQYPRVVFNVIAGDTLSLLEELRTRRVELGFPRTIPKQTRIKKFWSKNRLSLWQASIAHGCAAASCGTVANCRLASANPIGYGCEC